MFHSIEYIFYYSGIFNQIVLAVENKIRQEIFHCIEYTFSLQDL